MYDIPVDELRAALIGKTIVDAVQTTDNVIKLTFSDGSEVEFVGQWDNNHRDEYITLR